MHYIELVNRVWLGEKTGRALKCAFSSETTTGTTQHPEAEKKQLPTTKKKILKIVDCRMF